ncbi:uncharacterized protein LOC111696604 isoform X2 [Eurytemora carolleeae]|uniref:uncharacterized protein LOC111696604 isoform X2 n=1 Tax=Eurytemora carolleeae TaxID=1294199 RepID=UPI000C7900A5|nr:uncharacterized protein LOC111696604 isoform X2 [Eurytemora carolleeae]|eukprot:XP_023322013.1 uncharacterized protein LOC111696604 isoform X2 [Eurytemora affinis]
MRNLWYYGFLALMYVFTTWAVETFGEQQTSMGNPLFKILIPPPPPGAREPVPTGKRVRREGESQALLETMSLSYGGNYYVSESIKQGRELAGAIASALGALVDMKLVRSVVDGVVERFREGRSDLGVTDRDRSDLDLGEGHDQENLKEGITTLVGAALGEQQCWERSACLAGEYAAELPGKDVLFIVLDRLTPTSWIGTLNTIKQSATYIQDCSKYQCSAESKNPREN